MRTAHPAQGHGVRASGQDARSRRATSRVSFGRAEGACRNPAELAGWPDAPAASCRLRSPSGGLRNGTLPTQERSCCDAASCGSVVAIRSRSRAPASCRLSRRTAVAGSGGSYAAAARPRDRAVTAASCRLRECAMGQSLRRRPAGSASVPRANGLPRNCDHSRDSRQRARMPFRAP